MINRIIIDASPIIFLSKTGVLELINTLLSKKIAVPQKVIDEIYQYDIPFGEEREISGFLKKNEIVETTRKIIQSSSLSETDNELLSYAIEKKYDLIITDDNLVRKIAKYEKIQSIGTLGILLKCTEKDILKADTAKKLINDLIEKRYMRISLDVYKNVISCLELILS